MSTAEHASLALYRKYRPASFDEVRDQDHIVEVLKGAIKKNTLPHALLFVGTRGTGKTTIARIFAKEVGASDIDTYEIDAASTRGIDDIRELSESVHTMPYESKHKVYIIDEVHMLTKEAFNAFLKTLEEPPAHVLFILATTEVHKLLPTIVSRCQVFQFNTPGREELKNAVVDIATKEGYSIEKDAADLIALAGDGSYRDTFGVLQKILMASDGKNLDADTVARVVGAPRTSVLRGLIEAINKGDISASLSLVRDAEKNGVDMEFFMRLLIERVRAVMLLRHQKSASTEILSPFTPDESDVLLLCANNTTSPINSRLLLCLLTAMERARKSGHSSLPLELGLITALTREER